MAHCTIRFLSQALQKQTGVNVILPEPGVKGPFPVYYLLHGISDDYTIWGRRTNIERYVEGLPLIVVMVDGGRSLYADAVQGEAYESAIFQDLVPFIDQTFHTIQDRSGRCIGGNSMGGYGALRLALRHPHLFGSANGHSSAVDFGRGKYDRFPKEWIQELERIVGKNPEGTGYDLFHLCKSADRKMLPAIRLDCGVNDYLIEPNREFHRYLEEIGLPHEYEEFPGAHDWAYWDLHVREVIPWHLKQLGKLRA